MRKSKLPHSGRIAFVCQNQGVISQTIKSTDESSYSSLSTVAMYMSENYPDLYPPQFPENLRIVDQKHSLQQRKILRRYLEPWCDFLNLLIDPKSNHGQIIQKDQTLILICKTSQQYYKIIKEVVSKTKFQTFSQIKLNQLRAYKKSKMVSENKVRVGVINFAASQLKNNAFVPKVNLLSLFTGIWYCQTDEWRRYDVLKAQYPSQQEIAKTDVFILSGSTFSVNDQNPQIEKTMKLMLDGMQKNKNLKLLGLCFGHQAIANYFGGKVEKRSLYSGIQLISFKQQQISKYSYLQKIKTNKEFLLFEFHSDYVTKIPNNFKIIGQSKSCQNQAMVSQDGRCLSFQCHSEYTYGYTKDFEIRLKNHANQDQNIYQKNYKLQNEAIEKYGMQRHIDSFTAIRQAIRDFIQWKPKP